eukprot:CAMPEP_0168557384 /NCGR_PEP_ID=MMETSP0413-20121227/9398_1 /TAXON_ID=136452 /ORGANISM="Filamoeba nolandi, Strain NC-AS-23-1" /LENGTH=130 /DNA_ID=CAMNT_0008588415 /DNA_START=81 /DNA_END=474 /DNA_ORIENTATION=-
MANILSVCNNPRRRTRALNVNFNSTVAAAEQAQNINRISHLPVHPVPEEEEYRPLWDWYSTHNQFHLLSNFHEAYLEVLVEAMQPFIAEEAGEEHILAWAKTASTYDALAVKNATHTLENVEGPLVEQSN